MPLGVRPIKSPLIMMFPLINLPALAPLLVTGKPCASNDVALFVAQVAVTYIFPASI